MMEWVLPTNIRQRFFALEKEFASRPELLGIFAWRFLARNFFGNIQRPTCCTKKMLRASAAVGVRSYTTNQPGVRRAKPGGP